MADEILEEIIAACPSCEQFIGASILASLLALGVALLLIIVIGVYVYTSLARMTIAKKLKHKRPWLAWIPFARDSLILQLGGFHWAWIFLVLLPILGWIPLIVLILISFYRIYEKRKYPGWLALIPILSLAPAVGWLAHIANLIILGFVAWKDR
jgi:hypothetical protein